MIHESITVSKFIVFLGCINPNECEKHNLKWPEINCKAVGKFTLVDLLKKNVYFYTMTKEEKAISRNRWSDGPFYLKQLTDQYKNRSAMSTGVLCLVLFLSVGMLFSNVRTWELNCYNWEGRHNKSLQFLSGKCMAEYCLLTYFIL